MIKELVDQLKAKVPGELKFSSTILLLGKVYQKLESRVVDLESRQLQKGDKGDKGDPGIAGHNGKNGADGKDGRDGAQGIAGKNGKDGTDGVDGNDGVSVIDADIALDDHLVLKLSNGDIIDAGELPKTKSMTGVMVSGNAWQITVSTTAPSNPQINQLWFDIT